MHTRIALNNSLRGRLHRAALVCAAATTIVLTAAILTAAWPATPASAETAQPATGPQLSIAITDNIDDVAIGTPLAYTIVVTNLGADNLSGLIVNQSVPAGVTFISANADGALDGVSVGWLVDIAAGAQATLTTAMTVATMPTTDQRLASVSCALTAPTAAPTVCASDSDALPLASPEASSAQSGPSTGILVPVAIAIFLVLLALGVFAVRRTRRSRRSR
ncbi:MAG: hypothetical protein JWQ64_3701 [Subtercola sp.]|nr:hypothetical protein [Subtercola sp.]